jgi:peptidoglycan/xylan/chitin deacetylase (PgdA/CDA1 family)
MNRPEHAAAVISIDTELAWGEAHRRDGTSAGHRYAMEREVIGSILGLFERHGISATWAVVGHLFLDRCSREDGQVHPEIVRPAFPWLDGDWFDIDPTTSLTEAPYFYGRDIVERIASCPVQQEIGCHSFSHLMAGEAGCSAAAFESDLEACETAASAAGVTLRSFVFPRNAIGHAELLSAHGYTCFRGTPDAPFGSQSPTVRRLLRLVDRVRPLSGSAVRPRREVGLWNLPQTFLFAPATHLHRLPIGWWARQPIARLRQAARERSIFHLWFHPYNITADADRALRGLELVCAEAARLRDAGRLDVLPMGDLAALLTTTQQA